MTATVSSSTTVSSLFKNAVMLKPEETTCFVRGFVVFLISAS
ncbi:hypothetical protein [uncultured Chryseobacterium sp.]|nr:hypothetical protein [uncultured Chryseobacterium sp.]